jgi:spermidine synthase
VAGVSGAAVTVLEFAAVRVMAPWFGQSNYVWANVIGVILLALSLGYWVGGRRADRSDTARPLFVAYALAAAWLVVVAFLGPRVFSALMPTGIDSTRILPLAFTGSLVATLSLFGPPTLVLGMTSPFLIRLADRPGTAGRVSGRIFAVGTLGSLAGCYLAPLWLLQTLGSRATLLLSAAALGLLAVGGLWGGAKRLSGLAAGVLLLSVAAMVYALAARPPLRVLEGQIEEVESSYQTIRVAEGRSEFMLEGEIPLQGTVTKARTRYLRHDEDAETYQSAWLPDDAKRLLTGGRYFDHFALGAWFFPPPAGRPTRVLIIGYAGGAVHRTLRDALPPERALEVLGVEIDPEVIEVARRHLDLRSLEGPHLTLVTGEDARTVVNALPADRRFDLVLVDAYARTNYVPFQLATVEFFERLARHLEPGGWIGVNVMAPRGVASLLARSVAATMDEALGYAALAPNPHFPGNLLVWGAPGAERAPRVHEATPLHPALRTPAFALERMLIRHVRGERGVVLTDDLSPSDRLADEELFGS